MTDDYRYMQKLGLKTTDWMNNRRWTPFDSIAPRAALGKRMADFSGSFDVIQDYASYGGREFEGEKPGADNFDVMGRTPKARASSSISKP